MKAKIFCEFIGTALLLAVITGSGIMGANLSPDNNAVALLGNCMATGAGLYVLITLLGPISGAHFNPSVSLMFWRAGALGKNELLVYIGAQLLGGIAGVWLTHLMFQLPIIETSTHARAGFGIWVSELVSTLILLSVIYLGVRNAPEKVPMLVALAVTAGYWFTSSTFFANPAVALARSFTDTFAGVSPENLVSFISAELVATVILCLCIRR